MKNTRLIPITDIKAQNDSLASEISSAIEQVIDSQQFILGPITAQFEKNFADYCAAKYCIAVNSGTDALFASLIAIGIDREDEVIVPAFTFAGTAEVVSLLGAKVVFCDINKDTGLIDTHDLKNKISSKTKAIIPVHLYGQLAPMRSIIKLAREYKLAIIEDAAQAHGATQSNRKAPVSTLATYSFYPAKNLGAFGDAGAIVTSDWRVYEKLKLLRNHGQKEGQKYRHYSVGYNFRISELQAAVLNVKLQYLDEWVKKRQQLAKIYNDRLSQIPHLSILSTLKANLHGYHLYCIRSEYRNQLSKYLEKHHVQSRIHYPTPLHLQPMYKHLGHQVGDFPGAETLSQQVLCLPIYPELSESNLNYIIDLIEDFFK